MVESVFPDRFDEVSVDAFVEMNRLDFKMPRSDRKTDQQDPEHPKAGP